MDVTKIFNSDDKTVFVEAVNRLKFAEELYSSLEKVGYNIPGQRAALTAARDKLAAWARTFFPDVMV